MAAGLQASGGKVFPGESAHMLYTTMGFPIDLTTLMAEEKVRTPALPTDTMQPSALCRRPLPARRDSDVSRCGVQGLTVDMAKFEQLFAHEKELSSKAAADKKLGGGKDLRLEAEQTSWLHSRGLEVGPRHTSTHSGPHHYQGVVTWGPTSPGP